MHGLCARRAAAAATSHECSRIQSLIYKGHVRTAPAFVLASVLAASAAGCGERAGESGGPREGVAAAGSRGALSATLRAALDAGDLAGAEAALERLERDHEGVGEL